MYTRIYIQFDNEHFLLFITNYQISLYTPHENKKIERRVRKTSEDKWRSRKSGKNEYKAVLFHATWIA